jgi:hypothetical protein
MSTRRTVLKSLAALASTSGAAIGSPSKNVQDWMIPQDWKKQRTGPVVSLGRPGDFDDTHIFAPMVAKEKGRYFLWYPGSRGVVADRTYRLGLARSNDGVEFQKNATGPVLGFDDGLRSILTPTLLRDNDGTLIRENGKLRMWFTGVDLRGRGHKLYEVKGDAADRWDQISQPLLDNCYAPTVLKEPGRYRMWYADVGQPHWLIRHAESEDGLKWRPTETASLVVSQAWEERLVLYPTVMKVDGLYVMWYSSYYWWNGEDGHRKTAIGFAVSEDGIVWTKHPNNPVLRPDASLAWESYFNSSQCLIRTSDGRWRMYYAGRKDPPWTNKYFALCTATWEGRV